MSEVAVPARGDFPHFLTIETSWQDLDAYGHVNNVVYYSYFDTAVTDFLVREGGLKSQQSPVIGVIVESQCQFRKELGFPDTIDAGIKVARLGNSSVRYEIALFRRGDEEPSAYGHFVHVWIDRESRRPKSIPQPVRAALEPLIVLTKG